MIWRIANQRRGVKKWPLKDTKTKTNVLGKNKAVLIVRQSSMFRHIRHRVASTKIRNKNSIESCHSVSRNFLVSLANSLKKLKGYFIFIVFIF